MSKKIERAQASSSITSRDYMNQNWQVDLRLDCVDPVQEYTNVVNCLRERLCWGKKNGLSFLPRKEDVTSAPYFSVRLLLDGQLLTTLKVKKWDLYIIGFQTRRGQSYVVKGEAQNFPDATTLPFNESYHSLECQGFNRGNLIIDWNTVVQAAYWLGTSDDGKEEKKGEKGKQQMDDEKKRNKGKKIMNDHKIRNQHFGKGLGILIYFVSEGTRFQKIFEAIVEQINGSNTEKMDGLLVHLVNEWEALSKFALTGKSKEYLNDLFEINDNNFEAARKVIAICKQPSNTSGHNMIQFLASSLASVFYHMALGCTSSAVRFP